MPTREPQTLFAAVTFRRLLDSMARPGKITHLGNPTFLQGDAPCYYVAGTAQPANLYACGALLTLLDKEVTFAVAANGHWLSPVTPLVQWLILHSGSTPTTPEAATFALFCEGHSRRQVTRLNPGTLLEPESSTTAFYCVERLAEVLTGLEDHADRMILELSGPGIESTRLIGVAGLHQEEIELIRLTHYPLGIDIYLIDSAGHCVGLPRTTTVRVLGKDG